LPKLDQQFAADVIACRDRGNNPFTIAESIDLVQELNPDLTQKQASWHFHQALWPSHPDQLKPHIVKAQATTTKRSNINLHQQYRWFVCYESAIAELRRHNTGCCRLTGKTFGELIQFFICGSDETCFQASKDGSLYIVGASGRKKHEKKVHDSHVCTSITLYWVGFVSGDSGPTIFLLKGERRKSGHNYTFLLKNGAGRWSTIIMTPNAFENMEAWEEMAV